MSSLHPRRFSPAEKMTVVLDAYERLLLRTLGLCRQTRTGVQYKDLDDLRLDDRHLAALGLSEKIPQLLRSLHQGPYDRKSTQDERFWTKAIKAFEFAEPNGNVAWYAPGEPFPPHGAITELSIHPIPKYHPLSDVKRSLREVASATNQPWRSFLFAYDKAPVENTSVFLDALLNLDLDCQEIGRKLRAWRREMDARVKTFAAPQDILPAATAASAVPAAAAENTFRQEGAIWRVSFAGRNALLPDRKGWQYIHYALCLPRKPLWAWTMKLEVDRPGRKVGYGNAGPVLDSEARADYNARAQEIEAELDKARANEDVGSIEKLELEQDQLAKQIRGSLGLGGREQMGRCDLRRCRQSISKAIRSAISVLRKHHPELARHLALSLHIGQVITYTPEHEIAWTL